MQRTGEQPDPEETQGSEAPGEASEDSPTPEEIENDPAHEPPEEGLKDLKGG